MATISYFLCTEVFSLSFLRHRISVDPIRCLSHLFLPCLMKTLYIRDRINLKKNSKKSRVEVRILGYRLKVNV